MARRRCEFCQGELPAGARSNRKFCSDDCRRGRTPSAQAREPGEVEAALIEALTAARSSQMVRDLHAGAVAAATVLARKIDDEQATREAFLKWADTGDGRPVKLPPADNVSLPTFLNYLDKLGLTVGAAAAGNGEGVPGGSKLGKHLQAVRKPEAS